VTLSALRRCAIAGTLEIMDQDKRLHLLPPLQMRLSMRSECPYLSGHTEQRVAVDINENPSLHDQLARAGFRRVENWVYKPACPDCNACLPWRVDCTSFRQSRNMARIRRNNADLQRSMSTLMPTNEHYDLFSRYVGSRHADGQMAQMSCDEFVSMVENSPIETLLMNYHRPDGRLVATVLTDVQDDGLSAVYSFFNPEEVDRSLGTYVILDLIDNAVEAGLPWLYLGYYVENSQKMNYKARFQPAEIYLDGIWQPYRRTR
jgi:arginine-tRNA-protein transferase